MLLRSALVVAFGVLLVPASASAATCADFPDQAAAQAAANTRDADGDGVFCVISPR
ncbi:MAG: hypothetical protein H0U51_05245 [Propionibacteriales bacterium]|nr:hypothetical protein [Propionibacteriales bacterium]